MNSRNVTLKHKTRFVYHSPPEEMVSSACVSSKNHLSALETLKHIDGKGHRFPWSCNKKRMANFSTYYDQSNDVSLKKQAIMPRQMYLILKTVRHKLWKEHCNLHCKCNIVCDLN